MKKNSFKKEILKFLILFSILYLVVFTVLNITGWLVRPKKIEEPEEKVILEEKPEEDNEEEIRCLFSEKSDSIYIPKIEIEAPLVFPESEKQSVLTESLDRGVVHYPISEKPGEKGQVILLGHSAPAGWPKIKYDWVFSDINLLKKGDEVFVFFNNCQYSYRVSGDYYLLEKGEEIPSSLTNSENMLLLISCWPPGKDQKRIAVEAELLINN